MSTRKTYHLKSAERKCSCIYKNIFGLLQKHNMSICWFSKCIGIPETTIRNWKNGAFVPSVKFLIIIADYFDVSLDYLCGRG